MPKVKVRRRPSRLLLVFVVALVFAGLFGINKWRIGQNSPCRNCNIILVSVDTLRADDLPCYGYLRNTAPNLCRFADHNILFTNTYSQSTITLDSHFSIFTSLYPSVHKVLNMFKDELSPEIKTLTEVLKARGYRTIYNGRVDDPMLPLQKGLGRGFDVTLNIGSSEDPWKEGINRFLSDVNKGSPTFLFLHTYQVHDPYLVGHKGNYVFTDKTYPSIITTEEDFKRFTSEIPPLTEQYLRDLFSIDARFNGQEKNTFLQRLFGASSMTQAQAIFEELPAADKTEIRIDRYMSRIHQDNSAEVTFLRALYDEKIYQLDQQFKSFWTLLNNAELMKKTVVIITGDHGEEFLENGTWGHGSNIYNSGTHVPLIMHIPGVNAARIEDLTQSIDIMPTLLRLVGLSPPTYVQGISLLDLIEQKKNPQKNTYIMSEHRGGFIRSIRDAQWKLYINDPAFVDRSNELYDIVHDPLEQNNVIDAHPQEAARLTAALGVIVRKQPSFRYTHTEFPDWINKKIRDRLIKQGYF